MREEALLQYVCAKSAEPGDRVVIGPGDDMGMVRLAGRGLLVAVDQVVAGRHFDPARVPPALVGRKAVTRTLSDVAAMAGRPVGALAAVTLPPDYGHLRATELFDGMQEAAAGHGCPMIGGDIAFHAAAGAALTCAVSVLAEAGPAGPILRSGARAGDTVYVTGEIGGAMAEDGGSAARHLCFVPRIEEALALAGELGQRLHAMIDLSDGLGRDAARVAERSGVRVDLDAARIPTHRGIGWRQAAGRGEDYELLFTASGPVPEHLGRVPVTAIGAVVSGGGGGRVRIRDGAVMVAGDEMGWEHTA